jgi:hypothetical protein
MTIAASANIARDAWEKPLAIQRQRLSAHHWQQSGRDERQQ